MQFRLHDDVIVSKTGGVQFLLFDTTGEYNVYDAKNYPRWLIYRLWKRGDLICSPNLQDYLLQFHVLLTDQLKQGGRFIEPKGGTR